MSTPNAPAPDLQRTFIGDIPRYYDEYLGPAWFGPIAAELARHLPADPGGDVLELACGTGRQTRPLRERLDPRRRLVATDLNAPMLEYARSKMSELEGITWQVADAAKLPFGDAEFGAVCCSLGIMFVPDKKAFMSEARRVLKPGGLLLFNVWDRAEENPCVRTYNEVIERLFPNDPEVHFRTPYLMSDLDMLKGLVEDAGMTLRRLEKVRIPIEGVTARQVATGQVRGTPRGVLLLKRGADLGAVIETLTAALEAVGGRGEEFRTKGQVIVVEAGA
jgi:SAM-dependent methyltransferase